MSPPLVVAYALAGRMDLDLTSEPLGSGTDGQPVYLRDIWPSQREIAGDNGAGGRNQRCSAGAMPTSSRATRAGTPSPVPGGDLLRLGPGLDLRAPPALLRGDAARGPGARARHRGRARAGRAGRQRHDGPYLAGGQHPPDLARRAVSAGPRGGAADFNSYGSRRGNHEVLVRGTFANVRLRNRLAPGTEGGFTTLAADGRGDDDLRGGACATRRRGCRCWSWPGKEYGSGSSRDWAAKGPALLGVRAVIAESFERIHRSNLIGMGILPLQFMAGESVDVLGLTGREVYDIVDLAEAVAGEFAGGQPLRVRADARGRGRAGIHGARCASTRRRNCSTTGTAASCTMSCAGCYWTGCPSTRSPPRCNRARGEEAAAPERRRAMFAATRRCVTRERAPPRTG